MKPAVFKFLRFYMIADRQEIMCWIYEPGAHKKSYQNAAAGIRPGARLIVVPHEPGALLTPPREEG
jgi:hypothetical protein